MAETREVATQARYRISSGVWRVVVPLLAAAGMIMAVLHIFLLKPFGFFLVETGYLYVLVAFFGGLSFIILPASKGERRDKVPIRDCILFALLVGISLYFASVSTRVIQEGWEFLAPPHVVVLSVIVWLLAIEMVRRAAGLVLAGVCLVFSLYPVFGVYMPAFMEGIPFSFTEAAIYHSLSVESMLGLPMKVMGELLIGFLLLGITLQSTGGGKFFLDLATGLVGTTRGGPAKIATIASAFFGSISGSVIANVVTTGSVTIPTMKRTGYEPHYAAAIEACASTGGTLMPPIMGAAAFIMASLLDIPYLIIAASAAIPSILYYFGLLVQVDAHAAKRGLRGIPKEECPPLLKTLKGGWFYVFAVLVLVLFLALRMEGQAPFYAMAFLLICAMIRKETRFTWKSFVEFIASAGKGMAELVAILVAIGTVIGSFAMTGVAHSFSHELVSFAGGNWVFMIFLGALASFILGMGMTVVACYIFLAIVLAPALISIGLHPLAVHLFILYWGLASYITPPVALGAITAATIAGSSPMRTGFRSMQIGAVTYFVPLFFVLNPALILHGPVIDIIHTTLTALIGVYFLGAGLEGYLLGIGKVKIFERVISVGAGLLLMMPFSPLVAGSAWSDAVGGALVALLIAYHVIRKLQSKGTSAMDG